MPPKFSLQSVLDYRHNRVEALEIELGNALQAHQRALTFLEALVDSQARLYTQMCECQQGEIDLFMICRLQSSLKMVNERIEKQQEQVNKLAEVVEARRLELIAAKQDEEALETLREKERERYQAEQVQQENRMQDDIYITRAHRRVSVAKA
jgi:flagellar export protein FliJ